VFVLIHFYLVQLSNGAMGYLSALQGLMLNSGRTYPLMRYHKWTEEGPNDVMGAVGEAVELLAPDAWLRCKQGCPDQAFVEYLNNSCLATAMGWRPEQRKDEFNMLLQYLDQAGCVGATTDVTHCLNAPLNAKEVFSVDILMGQKDSYSFLHRDSFSAVVAIVCLEGCKEVIQLGDTSGMSAEAVEELTTRYSVLGPDSIEQLESDVKGVTPGVVTRTILVRGDVCFLHGGRYHAAYNHDASLSINVTLIPEAAEFDALMDSVVAARKGELPLGMKLGRGMSELIVNRIARLGMRLQSACSAMAGGTGTVEEVRESMAGLSDMLVLLRMLRALSPHVFATGLGVNDLRRLYSVVLSHMNQMSLEPRAG
jgi:hypothetical protein